MNASTSMVIFIRDTSFTVAPCSLPVPDLKQYTTNAYVLQTKAGNEVIKVLVAGSQGEETPPVAFFRARWHAGDERTSPWNVGSTGRVDPVTSF